jgi:hypothetical protein
LSVWSHGYDHWYTVWAVIYLCNQCLSPLMLWVRISIRVRCTTLCDKVCQWLATGRWFSPGPPVSSTNKTDRHDITEILLKVALNTIKQTNKKIHLHFSCEKTFKYMCNNSNTWHSLYFILISIFQENMDGSNIGSKLISHLAINLRPRYHFCGMEDVYYERQPYR